MSRILKGTATAIEATFYVDEAATDSSIEVTIEVVRDDGTVLVAAGTPAIPVVDATGTYAYTLTPDKTSLVDVLTARWTVTIGGQVQTFETTEEIVGGFYFTLAEGRAADSALASTTKYTTTQLAEAREAVETECENITNVAWVPRYGRARLSGSGATSLVLPNYMVRTIRSIRDLDGTTAWTDDQVAALRVSDAGVIIAGSGVPSFPVGDSNLDVIYEHGYDRPTADIRRASLIRFRTALFSNKSGIPDRAESFVSGDGGNFRLVTAGDRNHPTGIPEVDAAYIARDHFIS